MDASGGGDVAVLHPSAVRAGFSLSHPTRLLVPVFLVAVFSHLVFEETRCQMDKHAVGGPNRELSVAEGPLCAQIYALHQVVGMMGGWGGLLGVKGTFKFNHLIFSDTITG